MTSLVKVKLVGASEITAHMRSGHCRGILGNPETVSIGEKSPYHSLTCKKAKKRRTLLLSPDYVNYLLFLSSQVTA
jgi:hypothetical protein